jgi:hypothetical protein
MIDIEDPRALSAYLRGAGHIRADESIGSRVLAGGVSNRTVLVTRQSGGAWVLKQALSKLRVPVDWFCAPERIEREAAGMEALYRVAPQGAITELIFCDPAEHVLAMRAVPEPHVNWKSLLLAGVVEAGHFRQFGALLHRIQHAPFDKRFDDRQYFEPLRLEPYYLYTAAQVPEAAAFLTKLVERTRATRASLVHGDYSPKNVLIYQDRLVLLDHEVIHWGDPAFDVGFAMAHFLSKARHLPALRARLLDGAATFLGELDRLPGYEQAAVDHTLACLLARAAGRSQLEYLSDVEKQRQKHDVVQLMSRGLGRMIEVLNAW